MPLTDHSAPLLADALIGGTAFAMPATMYLKLCTTAPSKTAAGTDSGIDPVETTMASDWEVDGDDVPVNTATMDHGTAPATIPGVQWVELWDTADSSGNRWLYGELDQAYDITSGTPVRFEPGTISMPLT